MTITALPSLNRTDPTFKADVDTFFGTDLPQFSIEAEAARVEINANTETASTAASTATTQAGVATTQAQAAAGSALVAGAVLWVSGTTYAVGDARYSPINLQTYRRKVAGAGITDPSLDLTNWAIVSPQILPDQTGNAGKFLTTNGTDESWGTVPSTGITLLATGSISGVSTLNITNLPLSKRMVLVIDNLTFASSDAVRLKLSVDNGVSFPAAGRSISNLSTTPIPLYAEVYNADGAFVKRYFSFASNVADMSVETNAVINSAAINALQIYSNNTTNFIGGTYYVYGEN